MRRIMTVITLACTMVVLSACNTVAGAARDVESVANTVDDAT